MGATSILVLCLVAATDVPERPAAARMQVGGGLRPIGLALHGEKERYDQVPFQGNIDAILKLLLERADEDAELAELFAALRDTAKQLKMQPDQLARLQKQAGNPWLRLQLLELARKQRQNLGTLTEDDLKAWRSLMDDWDAFPIRRPDTNLPQVPPTLDDRFTEWAKDFLERLDETRAGELLRESPAWREALQNMENWVKAPDGKFDWLGRVPENWRMPDGWTQRLGDWSGKFPRLPELPPIRLKAPELGGFNLNLGGGPRLGAPSFGGANISDNLFWALALILLALMAWFFYYKLGRAPAGAPSRAVRGPWPVDPAAVTTRTQLVQAFEYLALLLLGDEVRSWNHVAVAKKLSAEASRHPAAGELAKLYELARYTPGDDLLPADAQAMARRHLLALAGRGAE
jgi:hypothetical protein